MREDEAVAPRQVVGLVMQLLREIRENRLQVEDVEYLSSDLLNQGYTRSEITAAFDWVYQRFDRIESTDVLFRTNTGRLSFRVLHPAEQAVLRPEAYGMLVEMNTIGVLRQEDMETVLERAMAFGGPLGPEEISMIVHSYLFEEEGGSMAPADPNRFLLNSDTIH